MTAKDKAIEMIQQELMTVYTYEDPPIIWEDALLCYMSQVISEMKEPKKDPIGYAQKAIDHCRERYTNADGSPMTNKDFELKLYGYVRTTASAKRISAIDEKTRSEIVRDYNARFLKKDIMAKYGINDYDLLMLLEEELGVKPMFARGGRQGVKPNKTNKKFNEFTPRQRIVQPKTRGKSYRPRTPNHVIEGIQADLDEGLMRQRQIAYKWGVGEMIVSRVKNGDLTTC